MFWSVYNFEARYWCRRRVVLYYAGLLFGFPLLLFLGTAGYFDPGSSYPAGATEWLNAPTRISLFLQYCGKFSLLLLPAILGASIYRDFRFSFFPLLYAYPLKKGSYLAGKFLGSFTVVFLLSLLPILAILSGELILGARHPALGPFQPLAYIQTYLVFSLPNLAGMGLLVFFGVGLSRNLYAGFTLLVGLFVWENALPFLFHDHPSLLVFFDPFGQKATASEMGLLSIEEQNTHPIPMTGALLINRLFWFLPGLLALLWGMKAFPQSQFGLKLPWRPIRRKNKGQNATPSGSIRIPENIRVSFAWPNPIRQVWRLALADCFSIAKQWSSVLLVFFALFTAGVVLRRVVHSDEVVMLPLSRIILHLPTFFYTQILIISGFLHAAYVTSRAKISGMAPLIYTTATPTWVLVAGQVGGLILWQCLMLILLMGAGVTYQWWHGFHDFSLHRYLQLLFGIYAPGLAVWACISVAVHTWLNKRLSGILALLLLWFGSFGLEELGVQTHLLKPDLTPILHYSDLNGYGHQLSGRVLIQAYWLSFGILLLISAGLFMERIRTFSRNEKWRLAMRHWRGPVLILSVFFFSCLLGLGYALWQQEHDGFVIDQDPKHLNRFSEEFSTYGQLPQPRISRANLEFDFFPAERRFTLIGFYWLVNRHADPIDTLLVKTSIDEPTQYRIEQKNRLIKSDPKLHFYVHALDQPILPGDSIRMYFQIVNRANSAFQRNSNVLRNGSFITQDILPRIGYFLRETTPDSIANARIRKDHYQAYDSDLVQITTTISTTPDQTAFAPGELLEQWKEKERHFFRYKTSKPTKFSGFFASGKYAVYRDRWQHIDISIYHHPAHDQNLKSITTGIKEALQYNQELFSPYPDQQVRVIEYPLSEGTFATYKPNALLISESIFGVNTADSTKLNFPFYISAHEMTHHWFGYQLIPGHAPGATMLTESITEYLSLQIYKNVWGDQAARRFLALQHQRYQRGRKTFAKAEEPPLLQVKAGQESIAYGKGTIALNALAHHLGQDHFNKFLSDFFQRYRYRGGDYPLAQDFLQALKNRTPDSLQYLVDDLLTRVVGYENRITGAQTGEFPGGGFRTAIYLSIKKDVRGSPTAINEEETLEITLMDSTGKKRKTIRFSPLENPDSLVVISDFSPEQIVLDPNMLTTDRNREQHTYRLY